MTYMMPLTQAVKNIMPFIEELRLSKYIPEKGYEGKLEKAHDDLINSLNADSLKAMEKV